MKKRMLALMLAMIMALALMTPAAAFVDHNYLYTAIDAIDNQRLLEAGETTLPTLSETWQFDFRVDIVSTTEGDTIEEYAQLFYEQYEYGWGDNKDGSLLMILLDDNGDSVSFNDYYIYAGGIGQEIQALPDSENLYVMLDLVLTGENVPYEVAGETCANAVDTYMGLMASLLMTVDPDRAGGAAAPEMPEMPEAAPQPEDEVIMLEGGPERFIQDNAQLISAFGNATMENRAVEMANTYGCGVYVLTVDTMNGAEVRDFAKDYYTQHGLGVGEFSNGVLFLVAMDTREYVTITYGQNPQQSGDYGIGIMAFTDGGIEYLEEEVVPYLSDGDYDGAFDTYLNICEEYLSYYTENGEGMVPESSSERLLKVAAVIFIPLIIALIVCLVFLSQMKTAKIAKEAGDYVDDLTVTARHDQYTHTTRERREISKDDDSDGSGHTVDSDGFGGSSGGKF